MIDPASTPRAGEGDSRYDTDVLVIGSGFGGSVSALRLSEKGYRVTVLESGPRRTEETLPKTSWDIRNFLWAPRLGCYGIQRIHLLRDVVILAAHFIGGCTISDDPSQGAIDPYHRVWGYDGLHIVDGSTISANLGVNPSLTITAQAERAMSFWPNKGEPDPRPTAGKPYQRISSVAPHRPAVPAGAPAALLTMSRIGDGREV
ncbi:GMC oxidoreductase [Streptomyces sp. NPDC046805]|uniref:GMC oxidoreductase n=1 Tax=Streptomyces sp. NPDC046805 TaxID=3155134 RepID=UPI0033C11AC5